jgi:Tol biopolymer transport system component
MRVEISTPPTLAPMEFALSPDGTTLAFVALDGAQQRLWLRRLDNVVAQPLNGTDGAVLPFWSPDSRSIGFFASGKLKRIDAAGGVPQALADAPLPRGGSWNTAGTIIFAPSSGPLYRIAAAGGQATPVTHIESGITFHRFPVFLPDGKHFLFFAQGNPELGGVFLGSLDDPSMKRLTPSVSSAVWLSPDRMLFIRQRTLVCQHVDLNAAALVGDAEIIANSIRTTDLLGGVSVSTDGRIAYRAGTANRRQLTWFDRSGKIVGHAGEPDTETLRAPALSSDGLHVAVDRTVQGNRDVWLMDPSSGRLTRFTFDPNIDGFPVWSPDGREVAFESARKGSYDIYVKPSSGVASERAILEQPGNQWPLDWSKDGRFLLFYDGANGADLWALPMTGADRKPIPVATTPFAEPDGAFSPDGRWVAYQTSESGQFQIVVQPFPRATGKWQVSIGGGDSPRWSADGRELYFLAPDGTLMAAAVRATLETFEAADPVPLFQTRVRATGAEGTGRADYAVSPDGRFLINQPLEDASSTPIVLILNWKPTGT